MSAFYLHMRTVYLIYVVEKYENGLLYRDCCLVLSVEEFVMHC